MARMRRNLLGSFVFIWLVASSVAVLPRFHQGSRKESTSGRNNLPDTPSGKSELSPSVSDAAATYECLYVPPDLPVCDFERLEDSAEDITHSTADYHRETKASAENFGKDRRPPARVRRDVVEGMKAASQESPGRQIIVYTIMGCLPTSLPFKMPPCRQKGPRDQILEVRKLYPFTVKGLTRPPLIFPEFNFDRWTRMMKRLRSHAENDVDERTRPVISSGAKASSQSRTHSMTAAAAPTRQPVMPNRTTASSAKPARSSLTKEADIHKQDKSTKKQKPNERKIKVDESLSPIRSRKLAARKNSSSSLEAEKAGFDDLRLNQKHPRTKSFDGKMASEDELRRKKAEQSPNDFRVLHKSWHSSRDGNRLPEEEKSLLENHWQKDIQWSEDPEVSKARFHAMKAQTTTAPRQSVHSKPIILDDFSNDLSVDGHPKQLDKHNDRNTELKKSVSDMNLFLENLRKRREIRVSIDDSRQMIATKAKAHETSGKSFVYQHRIPRSPKNSKINALHTFDKSDRFSKFRSRSLILDNRKSVNGIQELSGGKQWEINDSNTPIGPQLSSKILLQGGNDNNKKNSKAYKMKDDLKKGWNKKSRMRKKYSDTLGVAPKHNKRIHRD